MEREPQPAGNGCSAGYVQTSHDRDEQGNGHGSEEGRGELQAVGCRTAGNHERDHVADDLARLGQRVQHVAELQAPQSLEKGFPYDRPVAGIENVAGRRRRINPGRHDREAVIRSGWEVEQESGRRCKRYAQNVPPPAGAERAGKRGEKGVEQTMLRHG